VTVARKDVNRIVFALTGPIPSLQFVRSILYQPVLPVVNCHLKIKDSGPEGHADYETDAMPHRSIVEDGDES
jgi:hypothetical protein